MGKKEGDVLAQSGSAVRFRTALADLQRQGRIPSVVAGVGGREGSPLAGAVGLADIEADVAASESTQYRIGSITKTFTAALVVLLASEGAVDLDDRVEAYLPGTPLGRATLRALLAHAAGVQREPVAPMWQTFEGPSEAELVESLAESEMVSRPWERWHYSNLGYAVVGQVVRRVTGVACEDLIDRRLLAPLALSRTTWQAKGPAAVGYYVQPYEDRVQREPDMNQAAAGVGGQLWSTVDDLLAWGDALCGRRPDVLPADMVEAMHTLHVVIDRDTWKRGWGLGLALTRHDGMVLAGHTGSMPGFTSALVTHRPSSRVAVVLANASDAVGVADTASSLLESMPPGDDTSQAEEWRPDEGCPAEVRSVLGLWWSEYGQTVFTWRRGRLRAHLAAAPDTSTSEFVRVGTDEYRVASGREHGELLRIERDDSGEPVRLVWATYPHLRRPR